MTKTNEAPERIWAWPKGSWFTAGASTHPVKTAGAKDVEYTRADHALAMVAAAYEDAAEKARDAIFDYKEVVHNAIHNAADRAEEGTPDDARAALDRMLADARRDALREAAGLCQDAANEALSESPSVEDGKMLHLWLSDQGDEILSLIEKEQTNE